MKVFLAGTSSERRNIETVKKSPFLLESFYYIKSFQIPIIKNCEMFLLDSGAFTFFSSKGNIDWEEYIEKYAEFIIENNIKYFFELDIDSLIGYERVKQYRNKLESLVGKKSIPVWHKSRGRQEFLRLCEEYNYIALGGIVSREFQPKDYPYFKWFIDEAHKRNCKIHGLGFTKVELLPKYHFDSVDSTRWNCARFGRIEYFDGKTIKTVDRRNAGYRIGGSNEDVTRFTFNEWVKFQRYAERNL